MMQEKPLFEHRQTTLLAIRIIENSLDILKQQSGSMALRTLEHENSGLSRSCLSFPEAERTKDVNTKSCLFYQKDFLLKALVGIERLSYLVKLKNIPLLPSEERDITQIVTYATKAIEYLETLD